MRRARGWCLRLPMLGHPDTTRRAVDSAVCGRMAGAFATAAMDADSLHLCCSSLFDSWVSIVVGGSGTQNRMPPVA